MSNVVSFPTRAVRDWLIIERSLRTELAALSIPDGAQSRLIERMKVFWGVLDRFDFNFSIQVEFTGAGNIDLNTIGSQISAQAEERLHAFTNELFVDRLQREIEACRELGLI